MFLLRIFAGLLNAGVQSCASLFFQNAQKSYNKLRRLPMPIPYMTDSPTNQSPALWSIHFRKEADVQTNLKARSIRNKRSN